MKKIFLTYILITLAAISAWAYEDAAQKSLVTITGGRQTLRTLIEQVEKQTGYLFVYSQDDINLNQTLALSEGRKTVKDCMQEIYDAQGLSYVFENNYIILTYQQPEYVSISGRVVDQQTRRPLTFASVYIQGRGISNVTNGEGYFVLKYPASYTQDSLRVSYLGYETTILPLSRLQASGKVQTIEMEQLATNLPDIYIRPLNAYEVVRQMVERIPENYPSDPMQMTGFYREMIRKGSNYVTLTEAVLDIYKSSYTNVFGGDLVGIYKGRGSVDWQRIDTVFVKFRGGINTAMEIDMARYPFLAVNPSELESTYDFFMEPAVMLEDKIHYVVRFDQKIGMGRPFFRGKLYIESKTMALSRAEFNMNVEEYPEATSLFIRKKPAGLQAKVLYATYLVQYKEVEGKWTLDYSRTELKFDSKWDKKLFKSTYTVVSEMAITQRSDKMYKIPVESRVRANDMALDKVGDFQDENFWEDYNTIEPESGIEQVISRIIKQLSKRR